MVSGSASSDVIQGNNETPRDLTILWPRYMTMLEVAGQPAKEITRIRAQPSERSNIIECDMRVIVQGSSMQVEMTALGL